MPAARAAWRQAAWHETYALLECSRWAPVSRPRLVGWVSRSVSRASGACADYEPLPMLHASGMAAPMAGGPRASARSRRPRSATLHLAPSHPWCAPPLARRHHHSENAAPRQWRPSAVVVAAAAHRATAPILPDSRWCGRRRLPARAPRPMGAAEQLERPPAVRARETARDQRTREQFASRWFGRAARWHAHQRPRPKSERRMACALTA